MKLNLIITRVFLILLALATLNIAVQAILDPQVIFDNVQVQLKFSTRTLWRRQFSLRFILALCRFPSAKNRVDARIPLHGRICSGSNFERGDGWNARCVCNAMVDYRNRFCAPGGWFALLECVQNNQSICGF